MSIVPALTCAALTLAPTANQVSSITFDLPRVTCYRCIIIGVVNNEEPAL